MIDYNFIYYGLGVNENAPYLSWGLGAFADFQNSIGLPYIPVRAGYEFKYGFIDLGAKLLLGIFPAPELRAGVGFCF